LGRHRRNAKAAGDFHRLVFSGRPDGCGDRRIDAPDLVEAAYTLGANARGVVRRVLLPSAAPAIAESLRLVLGWAWTYVIVAELIGASSGIGHMITDSQALLNTAR
jgi:ABC-type nitrate/sulfonate/bicarbonate transport system permease component